MIRFVAIIAGEGHRSSVPVPRHRGAVRVIARGGGAAGPRASRSMARPALEDWRSEEKA